MISKRTSEEILISAPERELLQPFIPCRPSAIILRVQPPLTGPGSLSDISVTWLYVCEVRRPPGAQPEVTSRTADAGALTPAHLFYQRTRRGNQLVRFIGDFPGVGTESPASEETPRSPDRPQQWVSGESMVRSRHNIR